MIQWFDTHFHYYGDLSPAEFLALHPESASMRLMAVGANYTESLHARTFAEAVPAAYFSAGVHPHSAGEYLNAPAEFELFHHHPKLRAVGEIGLDYYYDFSPRAEQRRVFDEFLLRALEWNLPAIVHCRDAENRFDAYEECFDRLRDFASGGGRMVLHCFAGTPAWAEKFLALGAYLGITGMVTFPKAENIRATLRVIPNDRLLLETDAPYLAPVPFRGKQNHPGLLPHIGKRVAEERGMSLADLAELTTANAEHFFAGGK